MPKHKRKLTPAERRTRRERKKKYMTVFINGKQKRVPRPRQIEGMDIDELLLGKFSSASRLNPSSPVFFDASLLTTESALGSQCPF